MGVPWITVAIVLFSTSAVLSLTKGDIEKLSALTPISTQGLLNISQVVEVGQKMERELLIGKHPLVTLTGGISEDSGANPGEELMFSDDPMMKDESTQAPCSMDALKEEEEKLQREEEELEDLEKEFNKKFQEYKLEKSKFENFTQARNNTELLDVGGDEEELEKQLNTLMEKEKKLKEEELNLDSRESQIQNNETALKDKSILLQDKLANLTNEVNNLNAEIEKVKNNTMKLENEFERGVKKEQDKRGYECIDVPDNFKTHLQEWEWPDAKICNLKQ